MGDFDQTGDSIEAANANWTFKGEVAENFDAHVEKSVPMYHEGHELVLKLSDFFLSEGSTCYDIGCSTGSLLNALSKRCGDKTVRLVGLDEEPAMIDQAERKCTSENIEFLSQNILETEFEPCDLIISYYTLQFIRPCNRQLVLDRLYQSLNWGGALILFEKVRGPDARFQDIMSALYVDYKLDQGYTPDNIVAKSRSLKGVLEPFSTQGNLDLLARAGFQDVISVMKYVCFEGFLAIK